METLLLLGSVSILILLGVPVVYSLGVAALVTMVATQQPAFTIVPQRMAAALDSFPIMAIPLFILMGNIMNTAGVAQRIYAFAGALVGHVRGGLAQVNVFASMLFAGMSGSAMADAAGVGVIEIHAMRKHGYPVPFSAALTAATAIIGPIIPPSIPFILYGVLAEVSIGRLFAAGIVPGVLLTVAFMALVHLFAVREGWPRAERSSLREVGRALLGGVLPMFAVVILIGGMLAGVFTPTEAAVVAVLYALFLGGVVYREISLRDLYAIVLGSARQSTELLIIIATASLFAWMLTLQQVPNHFASFLLSITDNKLVALLIINVFLLVVGCFLDISSAMIIMVPIFMPVLRQYGIDPLQFGVIMTLNLMIGGLTPPFAMLTYIVSRIAETNFESVLKASLPFLVPLVVVLLVITYVPETVLFVPSAVFGR